MYTKAKIFNLALGALLLQRQVANADTDQSNEAKVLNQHWDVAFRSTLEDLDLDSCSQPSPLELMVTFDLNASPTPQWLYAYKYPSNCAFFRRINSTARVDCRTTHIPKRVGLYNGSKVIFTDEINAVAEIIPTDLSLTVLSATAGLCIAYRLALLAAPLATGKGAAKLVEQIGKNYVVTKAEAQAQDERENFVFEDESVTSEFVNARLS